MREAEDTETETETEAEDSNSICCCNFGWIYQKLSNLFFVAPTPPPATKRLLDDFANTLTVDEGVHKALASLNPDASEAIKNLDVVLLDIELNALSLAHEDKPDITLVCPSYTHSRPRAETHTYLLIKATQDSTTTAIYLLDYNHKTHHIRHDRLFPAASTSSDDTDQQLLIIAEDDHTSMDLMQRVLDRTPLPAEQRRNCRNGRETLTALIELPHDAITGMILDHWMPDIDGLPILWTLRHVERELGLPPIPVLLQSALGDMLTFPENTKTPHTTIATKGSTGLINTLQQWLERHITHTSASTASTAQAHPQPGSGHR